jgi:dihydroxy-acid dehydratase
MQTSNDDKETRGLRRSNLSLIMGYTEDDLQKKPHIAMINTWNEGNVAHIDLRHLAEFIRAGIWATGGVPFEYNIYGECLDNAPTHGNLSGVSGKDVPWHGAVTRDVVAASIENITQMSQDGVVFIGGCDKTAPGLLLGAARCNFPSIIVPAGPSLIGRYEDSEPPICEFHGSQCTIGTCGSFGSGNSMQMLSEALGMTLPRASTVPTVATKRKWLATASGKQVIKLADKKIRPKDIMTKEAIENAIVVMNAMGLSVNSVWHLLALARELDLDDVITIDTFDRISREVPVIANIQPLGSGGYGDGYTITDLDEAGGVPAVMSVLGEKYLNLDVMTVTGRTLRENIKYAKVHRSEVIRPLSDPVLPQSLVVMRGNLCTSSIIRSSVTPPDMMKFRGPAIVFDSIPDYWEGIKTKKVKPGDVLIVRYQGPRGGPGMPHVMREMEDRIGVGRKNVFMITDGTVSGGSGYGPVIAQTTPEAAVGGPLAVVRDGDIIEVDVEGRTVNLLVSEAEIQKRLSVWKRPPLKTKRTSVCRAYELYALPATKGGGLEIS